MKSLHFSIWLVLIAIHTKESILFSQPTTDNTSSRVTLNSLSDVINGSLNQFKLNLTYLYKENSDKLTQLISSNEKFSFAELTKFANPKDYANFAIKIKLINNTFQAEKDSLIRLFKTENSKDLAQLINKVNMFQRNLKIKLSISVLNNQNKTLSILKDFLQTIKQLAKPNTSFLDRLVTSLNKFKLRLQTQFNYNLINLKPLINQQQINLFQSNFSVACDKLSNHLSTSFYLLNSTLLQNYNATTKEILDKVMKLYSNETTLNLQSLQSSNNTVGNLIIQLKIKLDSLFLNNRIRLAQMITSDTDLFKEFTLHILSEIIRVNIRGHINESLIKYEIDRTINSLETERANLTKLIKDKNEKYSNNTFKLIGEHFELNIQNKSMAIAFGEALSHQTVNNKNDLLETIKLALTDYKTKKNDETVMLNSIFRYHISHSEIDKPISKQVKQLKFVYIINKEVPLLQKKLETKHDQMNTVLTNALVLFYQDMLNAINSTITEILKAVALIESTTQATTKLNQIDMFLSEQVQENPNDYSNFIQEDLEEEYNEDSFKDFTSLKINKDFTQSVTSSSQYFSNDTSSPLTSNELLSNQTTSAVQLEALSFSFNLLNTSTNRNDWITSTKINKILTDSIVQETKTNYLNVTQTKSELINTSSTNHPISNSLTETTEATTESIDTEKNRQELTAINETIGDISTIETEEIINIQDHSSVLSTTSVDNDKLIHLETKINEFSNSEGLATNEISFNSESIDSAINTSTVPSETTTIEYITETFDDPLKTKIDDSLINTETITYDPMSFISSSSREPIKSEEIDNYLTDSSSLSKISKDLEGEINAPENIVSWTNSETIENNSEIISFPETTQIPLPDYTTFFDTTNESANFYISQTNLSILDESTTENPLIFSEEINANSNFQFGEEFVIKFQDKLDYLKMNLDNDCLAGLIIKFFNNHTKIIGRQDGISSNQLSLANRTLYSFKSTVINENKFIKTCFREANTRVCHIIPNRFKSLELNEFDLESMTSKSGKHYEAIGLSGTFNPITKCVSKLGVVYKEIKKESEDLIKQIVFISMNRSCINGLRQHLSTNKTTSIGNVDGSWQEIIHFENKHLVSFNSITENNSIEFCFRNSDTEDTLCDTVENNYSKLVVSKFDLDEMNTPQVKYQANSLFGTFDKKTKCISKLGIDFSPICGTDDTKPC